MSMPNSDCLTITIIIRAGGAGQRNLNYCSGMHKMFVLSFVRKEALTKMKYCGRL
jgi:hypothetical protein